MCPVKLKSIVTYALMRCAPSRLCLSSSPVGGNGLHLHNEKSVCSTALPVFSRTVLALRFGQGGIHPGVIVFIVLSDFCIHLPLALHPARQQQPGFWHQYAYRRGMRIVPICWLASLLGIGVLLLSVVYPSLRPAFVTDGLDGIAIAAKLPVVSVFLPFHQTGLGNEPLATVATEMWLYAIHLSAGNNLEAFGRVVECVRSGRCDARGGVPLLVLGVNPTVAVGSYFAFDLYWVIGAFAVELFAGAMRAWEARRGWWWTGSTFALFLVMATPSVLRGPITSSPSCSRYRPGVFSIH